MKIELLILGLLMVSVLSTETEGDAADTLAARFIFKTDADRRLMIDFTFRTNPTQIFQLAYGLKRQKLYDLIRAYLHPNIANIVLYGSYSFFIQYNKPVAWNLREPVSTNVAPSSVYGYYLSAHRYFDQDKRSEKSTYANIHSFGWGAKRWRLTPVASTYAGTAFYISLVIDEHQYDSIDQAGWFLTLQRLVAFDKYDSQTSHLILMAPPCQSNVWTLTPVDRGDSFLITLSFDDNQYDGVSQTGFSLDYIAGVDSERRSSDVNGFDDSYYCSAVNKAPGALGPYNSWRVTFAGS
jgi:hypothetical protein